jgi:membrane fusion protein (multidrug efflux system)
MKINFRQTGTVLFLALSIFSCKGPVEKGPMRGGPVAVNIASVNMEVAGFFDYYPANIVALNEVQLRSELNGYITGIFFKEGQQLEKGQKLYEIDRAKYLTNYSQAEANLEIAKSNYDRTQKDEERYAILDQKEAIAKQRMDYATIDNRNAKSQVAAAQANLTRASIDLNHSIIKAPFKGTIGISPVKLGTYITAGQTILNTVSSDDPIAVDFVINEKEIPRFMQLKDKKVTVADSLFTILLPDQSTYPYLGQIEFFDRAVDPLTGTLKIRLKFPNKERLLKAGMSCQLRVFNNTEVKVATIPNKAVTEQLGEFFVYVVKNDTARQQKVVLGPIIGDGNIIVYSGLEPDQKIVVDGMQKLRDGSAIQVGSSQNQTQQPASK